jgi:hypothetical protein
MLGAWFPVSSLLHQHRAIAAANAQLAQLHRQDRALAREHRLLNSPSEIGRIAREQYQLVTPGQRAYEVLPPSGTGGSTAYSGDPGLQPLVSPSAAAELPKGSLSSNGANGAAGSTGAAGPGGAGTAGRSGPTAGSGAGTGTGSPGPRSAGAPVLAPKVGAGVPDGGRPGFFGRILQTLEFWR